jgi:hypothetical protein
LDGATGGLSTDLAGAVFGFNAACADFGTWGDVGLMHALRQLGIEMTYEQLLSLPLTVRLAPLPEF